MVLLLLGWVAILTVAAYMDGWLSGVDQLVGLLVCMSSVIFTMIAVVTNDIKKLITLSKGGMYSTVKCILDVSIWSNTS